MQGLSGFHRRRLYRKLQWVWATDHMRSPLFHHQLSLPSAPPTPERPSRLLIQNLHLFRGLHPHSTGSAPPGSLAGNITTLQDSLHGTDGRLAPPSQRHTPLQHLRSPGSTGRLLRGSLVITATGLAPVSRWQLAGHTKWGVRGSAISTTILPLLVNSSIFQSLLCFVLVFLP